MGNQQRFGRGNEWKGHVVDVLWSYKGVFVWVLQGNRNFEGRTNELHEKQQKIFHKEGNVHWKYLGNDCERWDTEINVTAGSGTTRDPRPRQFFSSCLNLKAPNWTVQVLKIASFPQGIFFTGVVWCSSDLKVLGSVKNVALKEKHRNCKVIEMALPSQGLFFFLSRGKLSN